MEDFILVVIVLINPIGRYYVFDFVLENFILCYQIPLNYKQENLSISTTINKSM